MSQWDDRIRNHRVWELLNTTGPSIDRALERPDISPESIDSLERLRTVISFCGKRLASVDASLVLPGSIEAIASSLTNLRSRTDAFPSNGDVSQLQAANNDADNILSHLASVPAIWSTDDLSALSESAASYRASLERHLKNATESLQKITEKIQTGEQRISILEGSLTTEQQRLANLINEFQSQFSLAQDKRGSEFTAAQNDQLTRFSTAFSDLQTQFSIAQNTRETSFAEFQRTTIDKVSTIISEASAQISASSQQHNEALNLAIKEHKDSLNQLQEDYSHRAQEILSSIEKNKSDVESLVGVIGNLGVTSGYQKTANTAKKAMYFWQAATTVSLLGLIFVAVLTAFPWLIGDVHSTQSSQPRSILAAGQEKSTDAIKASQAGAPDQSGDSAFYHGLATRIFLSLTFGIFAAYAGRQASHFMGIERRNRKLALELEALGPFIEPLDQDERQKFRIQVGERSFGVPDQSNEAPKGPDPTSGIDILKSKEIQDFLFSLYKDAKSKMSKD